MHDPIALAAELKRKDQILRDTEDQLAAARRQIAELTSRVEALQIHTAIVRIPAQPPDPDGGLCEPILYEKPIRDAGSIDRPFTSADIEPPIGTIVRDALGREWGNLGEYWSPLGGEGGAKSWTKVAGNYGPVTIMEWGAGSDDDRQEAQR